MKKFLQILNVLVIATFLSACDNSNNDNDPIVQTPAAPAPTPPAPTPTPNRPTETILWKRIKVSLNSDMIVEECEYPRVLTISNTGSFTGGPCHGEKIIGKLTTNELAEVKRRAALVAEDISQKLCQEIQPMVEEYSSMTLSSGSVFRFYDVSIGQGICYRGGLNDASQLQDYLENSIMAKYYHL